MLLQCHSVQRFPTYINKMNLLVKYLNCINLHFGLVELHLVQLLPVASHFALQLVCFDGSLSQSIQLITVSAGCTGIHKQLGILA